MNNGIKASEVIAELQKLIEEHGDLPVVVSADDYEWYGSAGFEKDLRFGLPGITADCFVIEINYNT